MQRLWLAVLLGFALLAAACAGSDADDEIAAPPTPEPTATPEPTSTPEPQPEPTETPQPTTEPTTPEPDVGGTPIDGGVASWFTPRLEADPTCVVLDAVDVRCWKLHVAADRSDPTGGIVTLPIRVTGPVVTEKTDAVVNPAGGPGFAGIDDFVPSAFALRVGRDVVDYDQRGTGQAEPNLECEAADDAFIASLQAANAYELERATIADARSGCIEAAEAAGIDLTDYNSIASAHDLEDIRVALGYDQWTMIGISYGGRLALTSMREHPDSIRAVVLDSVYDVSYGGVADTTKAIARATTALVAACELSEPCLARGSLGEMLARLIERHNDAPIEVTVNFEGEPTDFVITGDDLIAGLFTAMYVTDLLPVLPSFMSQVDQGQFGIVAQFIVDGLGQATGAADVMEFAVNCADNAGLRRFEDDLQVIGAPGIYGTVVAGLSFCPPDWPATAGDFNGPTMSDIPALILAGGLDPITPPGPTEALGENLSNSTFVLVPDGGHGVAFVNDCVRSITSAFIADPTTAPDTSCTEDFEPLSPS